MGLRNLVEIEKFCLHLDNRIARRLSLPRRRRMSESPERKPERIRLTDAHSHALNLASSLVFGTRSVRTSGFRDLARQVCTSLGLRTHLRFFKKAKLAESSIWT